MQLSAPNGSIISCRFLLVVSLRSQPPGRVTAVGEIACIWHLMGLVPNRVHQHGTYQCLSKSPGLCRNTLAFQRCKWRKKSMLHLVNRNENEPERFHLSLSFPVSVVEGDNHKYRYELEWHARTQRAKHPSRKPLLGTGNHCL